jgi:hypothetical protein
MMQAVLGLALALLASSFHAETWSFVPRAAQRWLAAVGPRVAAGWPVALAWAVARLFALMPSWRWLAKPLARRMALVEAGCAAVLAPLLLSHGPPGIAVLGAIVLVCVVGALFSFLADEDNQPGPVLAADAVGPHTTKLWWLQGVLAVVTGAALVGRGGFTMGGDPPYPRSGLLPADGPWTAVWGLLLVGLGLMSWLGAGPQKILQGSQPDLSFRQFARLFAVAFTLVGLAPLGGIAVGGLFTEGTPRPLGSGLLTGVAALPFALANGALLLRPDWMSRRIAWVQERIGVLWIAQFFLFVVPALIWLIAWRRISISVAGLPPDDPVVGIGPDCVFLMGAVALGMATSTLAAIERTELVHSRLFARAFSVWCIVWHAITLHNMSGHFGVHEARYTLAGIGAFIPVLFVTPPNILGSIRNSVGPERLLETGDSDTRPRMLLPLWFAQGSAIAGAAVVAIFAPELIAGLVAAPKTFAKPWELDQIRLHGSYFAFFAFLSWATMTQKARWIWRTAARQFVIWSVLMLGGYVSIINSNVYSRAGLLVPGAMVVILFLNSWLLRQPSVSEDLGIPRGPTGLGEGDLLVATPMAIQVVQKKKRASHLFGVGAMGSLKVTIPDPSDPHFPQNDFFHALREKTCSVTMRFANLTHEDDASLDVRGAALRIGDEDDPECFDLVFNTGSFAPPRNVLEFTTFVISKWAPPSVARRAIRRNPIFFEGGVAGLRRAPESYAKLFYYSQIVRIWVGVRGPTKVLKEAETLRNFEGLRRMFLVRYRLAPLALLPDAPGVPHESHPRDAYAVESGLPDDTDTAALWIRSRRPDERRPRDYLRRAFKQALARGETVRFAFQAQFHEAEEPEGKTGHALAWYNAGVDWDDDACPWRDLGEISLTRALDDDETERLWFNPGRHPLSMGVPASPDPSDYRSLGDAEVRVMRALHILRETLHRWGGAR